MCRLHDAAQRRIESRHLFPRLFYDNFIDALLRKINDGFQMSKKSQNIFTHRAYALREMTGQMPRRHFQPLFRLRLHHVHDGLRLGEIEPAVQEGSFCELASFRSPRSVTIRQCQNLAQGNRSTVALQFHNVFLRIRMGRTHDEAKSLIDEAAILSHDCTVEKISRTCVGELPAARSTKHARGRLYGRSTGKAHDADAAFPGRCRNGADRICLLQFVPPCKERKRLSLAATARFQSNQ